MSDESNESDVTVVGGGLAGMATAIHLARAGVRVLCLEAEVGISDPVGESLDWSAPDLLKVLGLPMEHLIAAEIATYKRHVILKLRDGSAQHYVPSDWLGRYPFNVDLRTLHVDRVRLNEALRRIVLSHGVRLIREKVMEVETEGRRVIALKTESGALIRSSWFVDASGGASSLFPRAFKLPVHEHGPRKVAMWAYFTVQESSEGTTLYAEGAGSSYMDWVWQIPIRPDTISVGYVTTGDTIKEKRQQGQTVEDIYKAQLGRFTGLQQLLRTTDAISPRVTSFQCRAYDKVAGPNWLVVGESASMVDPMTSNGVTAALRHAAEASSLIARFRNRRQMPYFARSMYARRVLDMARFFNNGIEQVVYNSPIRNRIGTLSAGDVYTIPAWSINVLYSRIRPRGFVSTIFLGWFLASLRAAAGMFYWLCRQFPSSSRECTSS